ncbi:ferritin-like domain-containing protein [Cesiribacter sp. SM1]|uniref:YciE/YciF ferroxidase family protein n=1 Tax=Cesiribacter sp. SM1 TaxID=2861196 RepID=UPI001CD406EC|nr:ferritin-like domain-containing protein [Cesiribacter sp. SM1]
MATEKLNSLKDLFEHEIKDLYSAESQLTDALPKMAEKASSPQLRQAFETHLEETKRQRERLEKVGEICGFSVKGEKCQAMEGLIKEGKDMLEMKGDDKVRDAGLIASAQRVEHYEMAGYGTARTYAQQLGLNDVADLLEQTLNEEKRTDQKLNDIAVGNINQKAQQ